MYQTVWATSAVAECVTGSGHCEKNRKSGGLACHSGAGQTVMGGGRDSSGSPKFHPPELRLASVRNLY